jgi:hypothetical protein
MVRSTLSDAGGDTGSWAWIRQFQLQVVNLRRVEPNLENYRLPASGYLAELDRMTLEIREYLWSHPTEAQPGVPA